ncbi:Hypothetical protein CINCED_3A007111 [Cinara cedri]|uniref:cyclin-dependent kinase n=1 Tax=Cinara cedri TaxID=506608 RepID=A0A5E4M4P2_9HEMI|nr:Hypothetical protein CINCED_3A007111 [Cinara cedri]
MKNSIRLEMVLPTWSMSSVMNNHIGIFFFEGAYGTVYKGRDLVNKGKFVAMKKIKIPLAQDGVPMTTLREIALLKQLDQQEHPNIVKLLDVVHGPRLYNERCMTLYLVFEHIEQDLATYMARCPKPGMSSEIVKVSSMIFIINVGINYIVILF